jgi:hypothetical protein
METKGGLGATGESAQGVHSPYGVGRWLHRLVAWRRGLVSRSLVAAALAILVAYLLGIVGGRDPVVWKFAAGSWCVGSDAPAFSVIIDDRHSVITTRVDALTRNNPLDSGDLDPVPSGGCERLDLYAPARLKHLFAMIGRRPANSGAYQQERLALAEEFLCRVPDSDKDDESSVHADVRRFRPGNPGVVNNQCGPVGPPLDGPLFAIGGEMQGSPPYLDFSRHGAFVALTLDGSVPAQWQSPGNPPSDANGLLVANSGQTVSRGTKSP